MENMKKLLDELKTIVEKKQVKYNDELKLTAEVILEEFVTRFKKGEVALVGNKIHITSPTLNQHADLAERLSILNYLKSKLYTTFTASNQEGQPSSYKVELWCGVEYLCPTAPQNGYVFSYNPNYPGPVYVPRFDLIPLDMVTPIHNVKETFLIITILPFETYQNINPHSDAQYDAFRQQNVVVAENANDNTNNKVITNFGEVTP